MVRALSATVAVLALAMELAAQQPAVKERTTIETDDAKVVTWVGCLRASKDGFDLTEVAQEAPSTNGKKTRTPKMVMLRQIPATLDIEKYVGRRVAITGATEKDVFEDIEVEVQTERTVQQERGSDVKAKTEAEVDADPSGHNILVPVSIREISASCR
jgi:hypothetical protein